MASFQKFIDMTEAHQDDTGEQKLAVFTFGRMNPPTRGHEKLINMVHQVAEQRGGDAFIFPSKTQDIKNPLSYDDKVEFLKELFPNAKFDFNPDVKSPFHATGYLGSMNYTDIIMIVGSDRVDEFRRRFNRSYEYFDSFEVISAGERDPDTEGVAGMSASKARIAAAEGDIGKFRAATGWEGEVAGLLMKAVKRAMESD